MTQLKPSKSILKDAPAGHATKAHHSGKTTNKESLATLKSKVNVAQLSRSASKNAVETACRKSPRKSRTHCQKSENSTCNSVRMRSPSEMLVIDKDHDKTHQTDYTGAEL